MRSRVMAWAVSIVSGATLGGAIAGAPHQQNAQSACAVTNAIRSMSDPTPNLETCPSVWWVYVLIGVGLAGVIAGSALDRQR
jgi:hypothetical protein